MIYLFKKKRHTITIVGRPNVGKSTFFNRLISMKKAITNSISGITRDINYGISFWNGISFIVIDTGGYKSENKTIFEKKICKQILLAIHEADIIIFVVDVITGLVDSDLELSFFLKKNTKKPIFLMINKVDSNKYNYSVSEFYKLGFYIFYCVSSYNGRGTGELLDAVTDYFLKTKKKKIQEETIPNLAIVGKQNVGKSTFVNSLLKKNQQIVTDIPGTTRDSINLYYYYFGFKCLLIDTAGIRKKSKIYEQIEYYSVLRSIKAIENSDICFLMTDITKGWKAQDMSIFKLIEKKNKGIIIGVNKCDLIKKNNYNINMKYKKYIRNKISHFKDIPIVFLSAKKKKGIFNIMKYVIQLFNNRRKKIKTSILNKLMLPIIKYNPPTSINGEKIKVKYCTQLPTYTPKFVFFSNYPQYIKKSYKKFIENKIRIFFDFKGIPINISFRKKN